jgi:hypothetical protein
MLMEVVSRSFGTILVSKKNVQLVHCIRARSKEISINMEHLPGLMALGTLESGRITSS